MSLDCTVRDISETGARIELAGGAILPTDFRLNIPKLGRSHSARTRWQRGGFAGIEFVNLEPGERNTLSSSPENQKIAKLEAEVARLRKTIEAIRADPSQARLIIERLG